MLGSRRHSFNENPVGSPGHFEGHAAVRITIQTILLIAVCVSTALGGPERDLWRTDHSHGVSAVAAAELSGWYATSETQSDSIEIRDIRESLLRHISRTEIQELLPWFALDSSNDGPKALAWTDSGRSLFIVVTDDEIAPDGLGSDAILRYDTALDELSIFARAEIGDVSENELAVMHHRGLLWVSTESGPVSIYAAERNTSVGTLLESWALPANEPVRGMCVARELDLAFAVSGTKLYRIDLNQAVYSPELVGQIDDARGLAYSDHIGAAFQEGLFVLAGTRIMHVPKFQATGLLSFSPSEYISLEDTSHDLTSTPCGRLLLGTESGASVVRDDLDTRLDFESWILDEFQQVRSFAEGLVSADGIPAGWVIDADVEEGGVRFHPPSPDGAAWVVMLLIAQDHIADNQGSIDTVRDILMRYAGHMPDGIMPRATADGIMHHWYDPWLGQSAIGWDDEYATLSTMLIVMAADRARRFYQDDPLVVDAANEIIGRVENWDSFIQNGTNALYFRADASGGPDFGSAGAPYNEGVIFIEQAAAYGGATAARDYWLDRDTLPQTEYIDSLPVTTNWPGGHLAAFVSLYPYIGHSRTRISGQWNTHIRNLLASNGAWVDDNAPRYMTVFSAGTTRSDWGGYHADSLGDHPGDVTTFPSLMAFSSSGLTAPSVGAYHAYRHGARQSFETGATMLYRRSNIDPAFTPGDAGLSDVIIGALGLAELIKPGTGDAVLAIPYTPECAADYAPPYGDLNFFDVSIFLGAFNSQNPAADLARPFGEFNFFDVSAYLNAFSAGCE